MTRVTVDVDSSTDFLLFSFLMFRLPPNSTLFPYTTLFRSSSSSQRAFRSLLQCQPQTQLIVSFSMHPFRGHYKLISVLDRKSTRLNSSHVRISYAVFCLKKKKYFTIYYFSVLAK